MLRRNPIVRQATTLMGGAAAGHLVTLAVTPLLTRLYDPLDFATYGVFVSLTNFCITVASLRLDQATLTASNDDDALNSTLAAIWAGTAIASIAGVVSYAATAADTSFVQDVRIQPWMWALLIMLTVWFGNAYYALRSWQLYKAEYARATKVQVQQNVGRAAVQAGTGWMQAGIWGLVSGELVGRMIGVPMMLGEIRRHSLFSLARLRTSATLIFTRYRTFAIYGFLSTAVNTAATWLPVPLASMLWSDPTPGLLTLSQRLIGGPVSIVTRSVGDSFHREFAAAWAQDRSRARHILRQTLGLMALVAVAAMAALGVFALTAVPWVLGSEWEGFGQVIVYLLPSTALALVVSPISRLVYILDIQQTKFVYDFASLGGVCAAFYLAHYLDQPGMTAVMYLGLFQALAYLLFLGVLWRAVSARS